MSEGRELNAELTERVSQLSAHVFDAPSERLALRMWLTDTITREFQQGQNVAPGLKLLAALEGLDFGYTDQILRVDSGNKAGGREGPPAQIGLEAHALAAVDSLIAAGQSVKMAIFDVENSLPLFTGKLANLRKKVAVERSKRPEDRIRYRSLIEAYENDLSRLTTKGSTSILLELKRLNALI